MCSVTGAFSLITNPLSQRCKPNRRMDGFYSLGPLHWTSTAVSRWNDDKLHHRDVHHLIPRLCRSRSLPADHLNTHSPGWKFEEAHRRDLLALGLFLTGAQLASDASAGQSNFQLADQYYDRSYKILGEIKQTLNSDVTSEDRLGDLETFKKDASAYVADYRRLVSPGQKSFAELYGVITAMIGFFTSFGIGKKQFPAKLKEKQEQRLLLAERLLERELARERKQVALAPGFLTPGASALAGSSVA